MSREPLKRDPLLVDCALLQGLVWEELLAALGLGTLVSVQDHGTRIGDPVKRRLYYARVTANAAVTFALRNGKRPRDWHTPALCEHCGPVWLPGEPAEGAAWLRVKHCPCCEVTQPPHGFARPLVSCADCRYFEPHYDSVTGKLSLFNRCTARNRDISYVKPIYCRDWRPRDP